MDELKITPPGEWDVDSAGRRFRYDRRCVEYEPKISTSCGTLTESQLHAMHAKEKERPAFTYTPPEPSKRCPFKTEVQTNCDGEACAWHIATGCAQACPHPAAGRKCPHTHTNCIYDCALRKD